MPPKEESEEVDAHDDETSANDVFKHTFVDVIEKQKDPQQMSAQLTNSTQSG